MDAGKVADVLDRVLEDNRHHDDCAKSFHLPPFGQPCTCGWAEVECDAQALVAELRAEAAMKCAPCMRGDHGACAQTSCGCRSRYVGEGSMLRRCGVDGAAVEGAPKFTATDLLKPIGGDFCAVCRAPTRGPGLLWCALHSPPSPSDLTGRSA